MAVESPLLETQVQGATDVIINVSGEITLDDASVAASYVQDLAGDNVNVIFGAMYDENQSDSCKITVIATGLEEKPQNGFRVGASSIPKMPQPKMPTPPMPTMGAQVTQRAAIPTPSVVKPLPDIKSSVQEQTLDIPSFLQKK